MDGIFILIVGFILAFVPCKYREVSEIVVPTVVLEERLNPSFYKDQAAFRRYLDEFGLN